jgi:hypothetical protein
MTIYAYFKQVIGSAPSDATLKQLPLKSPCGKDCKRVIDAGQRFIKQVDPCVHDQLINVIDDAVVVLWRG